MLDQRTVASNKDMIQGEIETFPLPDLIQWLGVTRRTGELSITRGTNRVEIFYAAGEIAAAASSDMIGPHSSELVRAVVASALTWRLGRFTFKDGALPAEIAAANQHLGADNMLLEAFSQLEQNRDPDASPSEDEWFESEMDSGVFTLSDAIRMQVADSLLRADFKVPPMPTLAARVLELTSKEDLSLRDLGNLILTDQSVAAQILRYANSAKSGATRRIDTLPMAVQRLGSDEVVNIVLAISFQVRGLKRDIFAVNKRKLWAHSAAAAFFARALAAQTHLDHNIGFLCGLLMDFGTNILYALIQNVLDHKSNTGPIPTQLVAEIVQDFHPRVGRNIGEKWRLPEPVIEAMGYHHCLEGATVHQQYVAISALADFLATFALRWPRPELEQSLQAIPAERLASHPAAQIIKLSPSGAATILAQLPTNLDRALELVID